MQFFIFFYDNLYINLYFLYFYKLSERGFEMGLGVNPGDNNTQVPYGNTSSSGTVDALVLAGIEDVSDDSTQQTLNRIFGHALLMASYVSNGFRVISGLLPDTHFLGRNHADHIVFEEMSLCFNATGQHLICGENSEHYRDAVFEYEEFVRSLRALELSEGNPNSSDSSLDPLQNNTNPIA